MTVQGEPERRLLFLRNIEAAEAGSKRSGSTYEFEVLADVPSHGALHVGPMSIQQWDYAESLVGRRHSLILSIKNLLAEDAGDPDRGPPREVCALMSVVLRRRISLGPMVRVNDKPMRLPGRSAQQSPELVAGKIDLRDLSPVIEMVRALPDHLHEAFLLSCRFYQEALEILDGKPDVAYLLLVSAIEIFIARLGKRNAQTDFPQKVAAAIALIPEPEARKHVTDRLLEVDRGIQKHFVKFMMEHITQKFWEASPMTLSPGEGRIESAELEDLLNRIYDQRSKMVHAGAPLPPNIENPPENSAEIDRSLEVSALGRKWKRTEFLPYVRFFERLVQHVLVTFLARQAKAA
jgi:hypothetical protein